MVQGDVVVFGRDVEGKGGKGWRGEVETEGRRREEDTGPRVGVYEKLQMPMMTTRGRPRGRGGAFRGGKKKGEVEEEGIEERV